MQAIRSKQIRQPLNISSVLWYIRRHLLLVDLARLWKKRFYSTCNRYKQQPYYYRSKHYFEIRKHIYPKQKKIYYWSKWKRRNYSKPSLWYKTAIRNLTTIWPFITSGAPTALSLSQNWDTGGIRRNRPLSCIACLSLWVCWQRPTPFCIALYLFSRGVFFSLLSHFYFITRRKNPDLLASPWGMAMDGMEGPPSNFLHFFTCAQLVVKWMHTTYQIIPSL